MFRPKATKDHSEREDEEAERLVREAPKKKPPRHDSRREQMDTSPDEESDKDLSKNYKTIGGSFRAAVRGVLAAADKVPAKSRETGKVVYVSPDTLKERPGDYEPVDEEEAPKAKKPKNKDDSSSEGTKSKINTKEDDSEPGETGSDDKSAVGGQLRELATKDPALESKFKTLTTPGNDLHELAKSHPTLEAKVVFRGLELPKGINTLGDILEALTAAPTPKGKGKGKPKPEKEAPKEPTTESAPKPKEKDPETTPEAPQEPKAPQEGAKEETPSEAKTEAAKAKKKKPTKPEDKAEGKSTSKPKGKGKPKGEEDEWDEEKEDEGEAWQSEDSSYPERPPVSPKQLKAMVSMVTDYLPPETAAEVLSRDIHPNDVIKLISAYQEAGSMSKGQVSHLLDKAPTFYNTDLTTDTPKVWKNRKGIVVPFEDLNPKEQQEAHLEHKLQVTGLSLMARDHFAKGLQKQSGGLPGKLLQKIADITLKKTNDSTVDPEELEAEYKTALKSGGMFKTSDKTKTFLEKIAPRAKAIAIKWFEASDYHEAKKQFIGHDLDKFSEHSKPKNIISGLRKARDFFDEKAKTYGVDQHNSKNSFREQVLDRLKELEPAKYPEVRKAVDADEADEYDAAIKRWNKADEAWHARKRISEGKGYRAKPFEEVRPEMPQKPIRYDATRNDQKNLTPKKSITKTILERFKKTASHFTYPESISMRPRSKEAVYHGIDVKDNYPPRYPDWQPVHQRDLGEPDYKDIVSSAKNWLKTNPVLSNKVEGFTKDSQLRAALDLAIWDSKYQGQIMANQYNELLARLAGVPEPGVGETLMTLKEASDQLGNEVLASRVAAAFKQSARPQPGQPGFSPSGEFLISTAKAFNKLFAKTNFIMGTPDLKVSGGLVYCSAKLQPYNDANVGSLNMWFKNGVVTVQVAGQYVGDGTDVESQGFGQVMAEKDYRLGDSGSPEAFAKKIFDLSKTMK